MNSLQEWLSPQSLACLAEWLQFCRNAEMLAELRAITPPEALKESAKRLSLTKREQIKSWVLALNAASEAAI